MDKFKHFNDFFTMNYIRFSALIFTFILFFSAISNGQKKYSETYRNQFHFSIPENKLGSPLNISCNDSIYRLLYQHNPFNLVNAYIHTGQATSDDLLHWKHDRIIWQQPENAADSMNLAPWWGSIAKNGITQIAWITRWDSGIFYIPFNKSGQPEKERSTSGTEKLKHSEPFVFWHDESQKWIMIAYERPEKMMYVLNSGNGIDWNETQSFAYNYGFPQLIELKVENKPDTKKWILVSEGGKFVAGEFNGSTFEYSGQPLTFNQGNNIGGSIILNQGKNKKPIIISEIKSKQQADLPSNGNFSFPAEVTLYKTEGELQLKLNPISSISTLFSKSYSWNDEKVYPGISKNLIRRVKGEELHIKGSIQNVNSDLFGFLFRTNRGKKGNEISFNLKKNLITFLNKQIPFEIINNEVSFEILLDRSVIEVYINNGQYVFSESISPLPEAREHYITTSGGEIIIKDLQIHRLESIWK
jgi:fructan beta-fructosidase